MWFIGVEVEQETSAPPPKKNPGSAPEDILAKTRRRMTTAIMFSRQNNAGSRVSNTQKLKLSINVSHFTPVSNFTNCLR